MADRKLYISISPQKSSGSSDDTYFPGEKVTLSIKLVNNDESSPGRSKRSVELKSDAFEEGTLQFSFNTSKSQTATLKADAAGALKVEVQNAALSKGTSPKTTEYHWTMPGFTTGTGDSGTAANEIKLPQEVS